RIARIRNIPAAFLATHGIPVAIRQRAVVAAARGSGGTTVLLTAVDPVGELVVGFDVVELPGRLVVPVAPALASVDRDDGSLIRRGDHVFRVLWVDPDEVIVVASRRAAKPLECLASVRGSPDRLAGHVDDVAVFR